MITQLKSQTASRQGGYGTQDTPLLACYQWQAHSKCVTCPMRMMKLIQAARSRTIMSGIRLKARWAASAGWRDNFSSQAACRASRAPCHELQAAACSTDAQAPAVSDADVCRCVCRQSLRHSSMLGMHAEQIGECGSCSMVVPAAQRTLKAAVPMYESAACVQCSWSALDSNRDGSPGAP